MSNDTDRLDRLDAIPRFNGRPLYIDRTGQPMSLRQWAEAWEGDRLVAHTIVGDAEVITMWMGLDNDPISHGEPLIFGSIIRHGDDWCEEIESATEQDALAAHNTLVARLQQGKATEPNRAI